MASRLLRSVINFEIQKSSKLVLPCGAFNFQITRNSTNKHWNPKFKKQRRQKIIKVDLPDFEDLRKVESLTPDEMRAKMKEKGVAPPRPWMERPIIISCTGGIFEPYVPPEGDGKISSLSLQSAKQKMEWISKKSKSYMAVRKIRNFEEEFEIDTFSDTAQEIYINCHSTLAEKDEDKLHELVTEKCFPEMMLNVERKTLRWKFIESIELPRVVHARCTDIISKDNVFAQLTVRFHSKQTLAIYDRFGRLIHGSEVMPKDVLEYVVFEKHLADQYGNWRIHGKIIPNWIPSKENIIRTFYKPTVISSEDNLTSSEKASPST